MKKFTILFLIAAPFAFIATSCEPDVKKETEVKREVIVVPDPPAKTVTIKEPEKKATSISVDKNGVKVEAKKIDISIKN